MQIKDHLRNHEELTAFENYSKKFNYLFEKLKFFWTHSNNCWSNYGGINGVITNESKIRKICIKEKSLVF